jgi:hypothetical protein
MASVIEEYLGEFERRLAFDQALARRARDDAAEYLAETIENLQFRGDTRDLERVAIARYGDPALLTTAYVEHALPYRLRVTWFRAALLVLGTFTAMGLRRLWLGAIVDDGMSSLIWLDRLSFCAGAILAGATWLMLWDASPQHMAGKLIRPMIAALILLGLSIAASVVRGLAAAAQTDLIFVVIATISVELMLVCMLAHALQQTILYEANCHQR